MSRLQIITLCWLLAGIVGNGIAVSQVDSLPDSSDILRIQPRILADTASVADTGSAFHPTKSPWIAVGLSAVLPGAGQIYTKNYWKVPVIWGLGGYWVYEWIQNNNRYKDFRDRYQQSITPSDPNGDDDFLRIRDFYRDQRDSFAWYLGLMYFLNLVDAYVGAHLYDFDVSPELTLDGRIVPRVIGRVQIQF